MSTTRKFPFGDDTLKVSVFDDDSVFIEIQRSGTPYLPGEGSELRDLADWIIENVPKTRLTLRDWEKMPIGAEFGFGRREDTHYPYRKTGEWSYVSTQPGNSYSQDDIRTDAENDLARGLTWRVPALPTSFGAVVRSEGVLYTLADDHDVDDEYIWLQIPTGGNEWFRPEEIMKKGFEVLFEGVAE